MMNTTGSGNIFIGFSAGNNTNYQIASNKLAIANSVTTTPLIDGDSLIIRKNYPNLKDSQWNDKASSVKIRKISN